MIAVPFFVFFQRNFQAISQARFYSLTRFALSLTYTESSILALDKSWIAKAIVAAVRVYASAVRANSFLLALVFVLAGVGFGIPGLAVGTLAGE